jgi:hypothetical protein
MSVVIDNTDDLLALLKKLNLKVNSVEELQQLLSAINAAYNPEAARLRLAKLVGLAVPIVLGGTAGVVTLFLGTHGPDLGHSHVAAIAVAWGVAGLVSLGALLYSFLVLLGRARLPAAVAPPDRPPGRRGAFLDAITDQPAGRSAPRDDRP